MRIMRALRLLLVTLALTSMVTSTSVAQSGQSIPLVRDAEIEQLLKEYTDPILVAAGIPPESVHLYLVADPSLNAFVAGGKNIFIHTGLIVEAERPIELQGVIAHETGHIAGGHLSRASDGSTRATLPMLVGLGVGIIAALAGAPDVGMTLMAGGQHVGLMEYLAYTRTQESAADQAAATYLERAGIAPDGMLSFFEKFRYTEVFGTRSQHIPPFWQTHPMSGDRIAAIQHRISESPYVGKKESPESIRRFELMRGKLQGFLNKPYVTMRLFPPSDTSEKARYARSIAYYRMVEIDKALLEVDSLIAGDKKNPYFYELKGQILFENGRVEDSIPIHQKAVQLAPDQPLLRINLAQAMIAKPGSEGDSALNLAAREQLEKAIKQDADNPFAYHQLAITYDREGDQGMAALYTAERYYHAGDLGGAASFAGRARPKLEKGSPAWQRASDILNVAQNVREDRQGRRFAGYANILGQ